jgi:uncharacterized protein
MVNVNFGRRIKPMMPSLTNPITLSETTHQWLIDHDYNTLHLNQRGWNGDTALMRAAREGATLLVKELLALGVEINLRNNDGNNALWFACFGNHLDLIQILIEANIDLNNQNDNGATALMYAASAGKAQVLKLLLDAGANPNLQNLDNFTALDFASIPTVLKMLLHVTICSPPRRSHQSPGSQY